MQQVRVSIHVDYGSGELVQGMLANGETYATAYDSATRALEQIVRPALSGIDNLKTEALKNKQMREQQEKNNG